MSDKRTDRKPDEEDASVEGVGEDERAPARLDGLHQGGTRGSSNQGGPDRSGEPEKDQALKVGGRHDAGSRSSLGRVRDSIRQGRSEPSPEALRGRLPPGATPEDYLGGQKPHKTKARTRTRGASGVKNQVV
jgi:hypothetical protein